MKLTHTNGAPTMAARATAPVRLTPEAREALRRMVFRLTGSAMRQVEASDALIAACIVAEQHFDETVQTLKGSDDDAEQ